MNSFLVSSAQNLFIIEKNKNKIKKIFENKSTQQKILKGLNDISESPKLIKFILEFYQVRNISI